MGCWLSFFSFWSWRQEPRIFQKKEKHSQGVEGWEVASCFHVILARFWVSSFWVWGDLKLLSFSWKITTWCRRPPINIHHSWKLEACHINDVRIFDEPTVGLRSLKSWDPRRFEREKTQNPWDLPEVSGREKITEKSPDLKFKMEPIWNSRKKYLDVQSATFSPLLQNPGISGSSRQKKLTVV